ncbi:MAG TPA: hypothetical protein VMV81_01280 [Phycisphaerae bacterium]|nr:hypothetical protein [Phycisphaerae bacterium]
MNARTTGLIALLFLGGCGSMTPPAGYIKVKSGEGYDAKYVSAHGNVVALTIRSNEDRAADLKFWTQAVEYQKVDLDGMKLAERSDMTSNSGLAGTLFSFRTGEGRGEITYLVGLYVTPMRIYTVEATGPSESFDADIPRIKESMRSIH